MNRAVVQLALMVAAFFAGTLVAEAAGTANTGTAASFGAMAFTVVLVALMVRR